MKKHLLIFSGLIIIIYIASCQKGDKVTPKKAVDTSKTPVVVVPQKTLLGRWDLTNEHFVEYRDGATLLDQNVDELPYDLADLIFYKDSTYISAASATYPALATFGVFRDSTKGTFHRVSDTLITTSSYITGLVTVFFGGPPANNPPLYTTLSDRTVLKAFTDTTLEIYRYNEFNFNDGTANSGHYQYIWDLHYIKLPQLQPKN